VNQTHIIDKDFAGTRGIGSAGDTWIIKQGVSGQAGSGILLDEDASAVDDAIYMHGSIDTDDQGTGIVAAGTRTHVEVGLFGTITGYVGIKMTGVDQTLVNNGLISTDNFAVIGGGANFSVVNNGTLHGEIGTSVYSYHGRFTNNGTATGDTALAVGGDKFLLKLTETSIVSGLTEGVQASGDEGSTVRIVNDGTMVGGDRAMSLFHSNFTVVNRGQITGDIVSFGGDSTYDFRQGTLDGAIHGGDGDDVYMLSSHATPVIETEDGGFDTIKSTVSYDLSTGINSGQEIEALHLIGHKNYSATGNDAFNNLRGNRGDNVLSGNGGLDVLFGGKGNDQLYGGADIDYFTFRTGSGHDAVMDYAGDRLDLTGWEAIGSFKDMVKHHVSMNHGDLVISAGHDTLTLQGVDLDDLQSTHFYF
jgi:Ca2+-binding RTX toxin-like protein